MTQVEEKQGRYRGHWLPEMRVRGRALQICLWEPPYWRTPRKQLWPRTPTVELPLTFTAYLFGPFEIRVFTKEATANADAVAQLGSKA